MQASPSAASRAPIGVLLANLGSPEAPTPAAVRRYLAEFLSDSRVIEAPRWIWQPILHGVILRIRPRRSAAAYASVWLPEGSPLRVYSRRQAVALQADLDRHAPDRYRVALAMRYGQPSIAEGLDVLRSAGCEQVLVLPLYPQYSATTTASVIDAASDWLRAQRVIPELQWVTQYAEVPGYIAALATRVNDHWTRNGRGERLIMSFHGLPQRYADLGDPYGAQCRATARALAAALDLPDDRWAMAFQSRFGPSRWLGPYTDEVLSQWAQAGIRSVDAVCPGFAADCLETLEEIAERYAAGFARQGGTLHYIPPLNDAPEHIAFLAELIIGRTRGWSV